MPSGVVVYDITISPVNTVLSAGALATFSISPQNPSSVPALSLNPTITFATLYLDEVEVYGDGCSLQLGDYGTTADIPYDSDRPSKPRMLLTVLVPSLLGIVSARSISVMVRGGSISFRSSSGTLEVEYYHEHGGGGTPADSSAPRHFFVQYFDGSAWQKATCLFYTGTGWQECAVYCYTGSQWSPCSALSSS